MAFIDFTQPQVAAGGGVALPAALRQLTPAFTDTEWQVVQLARTDGLSSLHEPGRLSRLIAAIFGFRQQLPLASDRLEALRRLSVESWANGFAVRPSAIKTFLAAGFDEDQLDHLLSSITAARGAFLRRRFS